MPIVTESDWQEIILIFCRADSFIHLNQIVIVLYLVYYSHSLDSFSFLRSYFNFMSIEESANQLGLEFDVE